MSIAQVKDISNMAFNKLTVVRYLGIKNNRAYWECLCDCGNIKKTYGTNLLTGKTKSCGCIITNRITKHNKCYSRIYRIWIGMKSRCFNKKNTRFCDYGGRGITVCDRWLDFNNFYYDMIKTYRKTLSLDRIDNNGNYEPSNCKWSTKSQQSRNTRKNRYLLINGVKKTVVEWCNIYKINKNCVYTRLHRGYSDYESIFGKK